MKQIAHVERKMFSLLSLGTFKSVRSRVNSIKCWFFSFRWKAIKHTTASLFKSAGRTLSLCRCTNAAKQKKNLHGLRRAQIVYFILFPDCFDVSHTQNGFKSLSSRTSFFLSFFHLLEMLNSLAIIFSRRIFWSWIFFFNLLIVCRISWTISRTKIR